MTPVSTSPSHTHTPYLLIHKEDTGGTASGEQTLYQLLLHRAEVPPREKSDQALKTVNVPSLSRGLT